MNLNFNEAKTTNRTQVARLEYGKHPSVVILGIEGFTPEVGNPYLTIKVGNGEADHTERLYLTEAALPYTLRNLNHIAEAAGVELPTSISIEEVNKILTGKKIALTLNGEEYEAKKDEGVVVKIRAKFGYYPFAAAEGETSKLSSEQVKRLNKATTEAKSNDLPF